MVQHRQGKTGGGRDRHNPGAVVLQKKAGTATAPAIITPWVDFLCVGGLSIVLMLGLLVYFFFRESGGQAEVSFGNLIILQALINWPHFMASYRLLYKPASNIRKHPFATIYVPIALVVVIATAVGLGESASAQASDLHIQQDIAYFMWLISAFYLAWHYTGQAWGMIASFSYLAGIQITDDERMTLRTGLRVLLVWHVVWGAQDLPQHWLGPVYPYIPGMVIVMSALAAAAFIASVMTFVAIRRRTGLKPTPQMLAPWIAVYLWYVVLYFEPQAFMFVQLSHALQYLIFPLRVEINRAKSLASNAPVIKQYLWSGRYYGLMVLAGLFVFYFPDVLVEKSSNTHSLALVIASAVSIHHYFVDSRIWKLSNKEVRTSLFSHINGKITRG